VREVNRGGDKGRYLTGGQNDKVINVTLIKTIIGSNYAVVLVGLRLGSRFLIVVK